MTTSLIGIAAALAVWPHSAPTPFKRPDEHRRLRGQVDAAVPQLLGVVVALGLMSVNPTLSGISVGLAGGAVAFWGLRAMRARAAKGVSTDPSLPLVLAVAGLLLRSGTPPTAALAAAARGCRSRSANVCTAIERRVAMGESALSAWSDATRDRVLSAVARAAIRTSDSGAALASAWETTAEQLRVEDRHRLEIKARRVGVHALAPLGLCFLPSFICLGVIPIVIGLAADIL